MPNLVPPLIRQGFALPPSPKGRRLLCDFHPADIYGLLRIILAAHHKVCPLAGFNGADLLVCPDGLGGVVAGGTDGGFLGDAPGEGIKPPPGGRLPLRGRWHAVRRDG